MFFSELTAESTQFLSTTKLPSDQQGTPLVKRWTTSAFTNGFDVTKTKEVEYNNCLLTSVVLLFSRYKFLGFSVSSEIPLERRKVDMSELSPDEVCNETEKFVVAYVFHLRRQQSSPFFGVWFKTLGNLCQVRWFIASYVVIWLLILFTLWPCHIVYVVLVFHVFFERCLLPFGQNQPVLSFLGTAQLSKERAIRRGLRDGGRNIRTYSTIEIDV